VENKGDLMPKYTFTLSDADAQLLEAALEDASMLSAMAADDLEMEGEIDQAIHQAALSNRIHEIKLIISRSRE